MRWIADSARAAYLTVALAALICGLAGILLPLLPTTPFLLLAVWAASKGSPRLQKWILTHPTLGPPLTAWREQGAVPTSARWLACTALAISWALLWLKSFDDPQVRVSVLLITGVFFLGLATFLLTRPTPLLETQFNPDGPYADCNQHNKHHSHPDRFGDDQLMSFNDIRCYHGCPAYADIRAYHDPEAYHE